MSICEAQNLNLCTECKIPFSLRAEKQTVGRIFLVECAHKLFEGQHVISLETAAHAKREVCLQTAYKLFGQKFHGGDYRLVNSAYFFSEDFAKRLQNKGFFIN